MSYARFASDSDVYVFYNSDDFYECNFCQIERAGVPTKAWVRTPQEMLAHLEEHTKAGHKVPVECLQDLQAEVDEGTTNTRNIVDNWARAQEAKETAG